ncbi:hypothetical protein BCh11DRAFT_07519 [Burkholderia sp. Ch1-1]|nr:hypothetical protein BCh11DRAFT_07519 [Burkholderia sp. Ch1-1]
MRDALKIATFGGVPVGEQFMLTESREWYTKISAQQALDRNGCGVFFGAWMDVLVHLNLERGA